MVYQGRAGRLMMPALQFLRITQIHDRNLIMFRDAFRADYQKGLSRDICSMAEFLHWQKDLPEHQFPHVRTTYCIGTSAGAYAAIASGYFLKVPIVWAFAPMTQITTNARLNAGDPLSRQCMDLAELLRSGNGVTEYRIYYNERHRKDREAGERMARCPGVRLFPQPGRVHAVVPTMFRLGRLVNLVPPFESS
jgi:hypothetical protein